MYGYPYQLRKRARSGKPCCQGPTSSQMAHPTSVQHTVLTQQAITIALEARTGDLSLFELRCTGRFRIGGHSFSFSQHLLQDTPGHSVLLRKHTTYYQACVINVPALPSDARWKVPEPRLEKSKVAV